MNTFYAGQRLTSKSTNRSFRVIGADPCEAAPPSANPHAVLRFINNRGWWVVADEPDAQPFKVKGGHVAQHFQFDSADWAAIHDEVSTSADLEPTDPELPSLRKLVVLLIQIRGGRMKAWVTKYALTRGILFCPNAWPTLHGDGIAVGNYHFHGEGREWHRSEAAAQEKAEEMITRKLTALDKQHDKLAKRLEEGIPVVSP